MRHVGIAASHSDSPTPHVARVAGVSLATVDRVLLVTGAGGMFGGVLRASGIGQALAGSL